MLNSKHSDGSAIASSSYATELIRGKTLDEALDIKNTLIAKELSLPPVKLHCSMLAEDAIKAAVKDYQSKRKQLLWVLLLLQLFQVQVLVPLFCYCYCLMF